jgi:hypothetical protein
VQAALESARQQWQEGNRRLDTERSPGLFAQMEAVTEELRKRVGQTFTLQELAAEYGRADAWARDTLAEGAAGIGLSVAVDAAFHRYARGALDYVP